MTIEIKEPATAKTRLKISINDESINNDVPDEIVFIRTHKLGHYEYIYTLQNCKSVAHKEE